MGKRSRSKVTGAQFGLSVTSATVVALTVPAAAMVATIYVRTAPVVFTRDGTDPTATAGVQADDGDLILLTSRDELDKFEVIAVSTSATLDVEYFTDIGGLPELIKARLHVEGIAAEDAAASGNPVLVGGEYDSSERALETGDVGAIAIDAGARVRVVGAAAEDAAPVGNPVFIAGRYRATPPTLTDGDVESPLLDVNGRLIVRPTLQDDSGNVNVQPKGDDRGVQYSAGIGQKGITGESIAVNLAVTGTMTTAIQATALKYLAEKVVVTFDQRNTDAAGLVGDVAAQNMAVNKGVPVDLGPVDPTTVYLKAYTTAGDDAGVYIALADRPDYRQMLLDAILSANGGAYWPMKERSGTSVTDLGPYAHHLTLSGATLGQAGIFGLGIDFDGTNDFLIQTVQKAAVGALTGVAAPTWTLDDAGGGFTGTIRDGKHFVILTDAGGREAAAYIGTSDVDADGTKVQLYTTTGRTTLGVAVSEASFDLTTITTFNVYKQLTVVGSFSFGAWLDADAAAGDNYPMTTRNAWGTGGIRFDLAAASIRFDAPTGLSAIWSQPPPTGKHIFISVTFEASVRGTLYFNGVEVAEDTGVPATIDEQESPLQFGGVDANDGTPTNMFNGRISHAFYIPAAKSDNWHRSLYEAGRR